MHDQLVVLFEVFPSWRHQTGSSFNFVVYQPISKMFVLKFHLYVQIIVTHFPIMMSLFLRKERFEWRQVGGGVGCGDAREINARVGIKFRLYMSRLF